MRRRELVAMLPVLTVVRSLDLVKVTLRVNGSLIVRWQPRAVAEAQLCAVSEFIASLRSSKGNQEIVQNRN
jgi:hypothetical protein